MAANLAAGMPDRRPNILFALADDWAYPHAKAYGNSVIRLPAFNRVCEQGVVFEQAYVSSPSCTPSRAAALTGQDFWRLQESADLWSTLPVQFPVYPLMLESAGYYVGRFGKGWGPGRLQPGGRTHHPAGKAYPNFDEFIAHRPGRTPFCFWLGSHHPHRPYAPGSGRRSGIDIDRVKPMPGLPDVSQTRNDIADYYHEVELFDRQLGQAISKLEALGELENTMVVVSGDNGAPFPRGKANLYDAGVREPLAVCWPNKVAAGRRVTDFVNFIDLAPTFLEAAGVSVPEQMTGRSFLHVLTSRREGRVDANRDHTYVGRERHTPCQEKGNPGGYPSRALRTDDFLLIHNFKPERWPVGTPDYHNCYKDHGWLGDTDNGPTKYYMWAHRHEAEGKRLYDLAFSKRPTVELYDLKKDPAQQDNVAENPAYRATRDRLHRQLMHALRERQDPRVIGGGDQFDHYPYYGGIPSWPGEQTIRRYS